MPPFNSDMEVHRELGRLAAALEAGFAGLNVQLDDYKHAMQERHRENSSKLESLDRGMMDVRERMATQEASTRAMRGDIDGLRDRFETLAPPQVKRPSNGHQNGLEASNDRRMARISGWIVAIGGALYVVFRVVMGGH